MYLMKYAMKMAYCFIISSLLCSGGAEKADLNKPSLPLWSDAAASPMEAYRAALQGEIALVASGSGEVFDIEHISETYVPDLSVEPDSFSLVDLDHDGTPELILSVPIGSNNGFSLVLRCEDRTVYSFHFSGRALSELKKDGTFWASGGANDSGICAITFSKDQYTVDEFTYCTTQESEDHQVKLFVDHQEVSETEWDLAAGEWHETPYADWYDYTDQNINMILNDSLS